MCNSEVNSLTGYNTLQITIHGSGYHGLLGLPSGVRALEPAPLEQVGPVGAVGLLGDVGEVGAGLGLGADLLARLGALHARLEPDVLPHVLRVRLKAV